MVIRSVILYLVLVGIPILGMTAVLQVGRKLQAPASFAGSWRVETVSPDLSCPQRGFQLVIEQSGPTLQISTPQGDRLVGQVVGDGFLADGSDNRRIRAQRLRAERISHLEGTADGLPCDAARNIPIRATRLQLPRDMTGH